MDDRQFGWVRTYYPSTLDPNGATRIHVRAGEDLTGLDIRMESAPVSRVSGTLVRTNGEPAPGTTVELAPAGELQPRPFTFQTKSGAGGEFEFAAVPDGRWLMTAHTASDGDAWMAQTVTGRPVEGIQLRLLPRFTVSGKVVREAGAGQRETEVRLLVVLSLRAGSGTSTARVADDGTFQATNVQPGEYLVEAYGAGQLQRTYLASIQMGGRELLGEIVELTSAPPPLTVVFRGDGGTVRGTVEQCGGATVLLVSQETRLQTMGESRTASCSENGQFQITNVRPGEYYAFALDEPPGAMGYSVFSEQTTINQAVKVTVRPGEASAMSLQVRALN